MGVFLALVAAVCFAVATSLQFEAASTVGNEFVLRPSLVFRLLGDLRFGVGSVFDIAGGAFQFFALKYGDVTTVMPLVSSGFVLAVAIERVAKRQHVRVQELGVVAIVGTALAFFLTVAPQPIERRPDEVSLFLLSAPAVTAGLVALTILRRRLSERPTLQALVGGSLLGVVAVLERAVGEVWSLGGIRSVLVSLPLWSLVVVGSLALVIVQSSFNGARIQAQLPLVSATEAFSAVGFSFVFLGLGAVEPLQGLACVATLAVEAAGLWYLIREPSRSSGERR